MVQVIKSFLTNTSLDELFIETVLKRLVSFGLKLKEGDAWAISFCIQKVENHIKNSCNTLNIPNGLFNVAVDRVCGEYLFMLKHLGKLAIEGLEFGTITTSIKEGDTQVQFASGSSDDERITNFINYLITRGEGELVCYRKIKW